MNPYISLVTLIRVVRMSENLKPEATGKERYKAGAHAGVKRDSASGKF